MLYLEATRKGKILDLDGRLLGDFGTEEDAQGFISNFLKPRFGGWLYRLPALWLTPQGIDVLGANLKARGLRLLQGGSSKDQDGRGGGSCCYVFPNIGRNGGVKETNLFVLPQDLKTMDSLVNQE